MIKRMIEANRRRLIFFNQRKHNLNSKHTELKTTEIKENSSDIIENNNQNLKTDIKYT